MIFTAFHHFPPLKAEWLVPRSVQEKAREHSMWAYTRIEKRLQQKTDRPDFMHYVLENYGGEKGMSREEINSNATLLILAGSDTSATTCTSETWFLVKNPSTLEKLKREVRSSFKSFDEITVTTAAKLPYLHAVIQEALRLHPSGPISVPRQVDRPGVTISGHPVPVGVCPSDTLFSQQTNTSLGTSRHPPKNRLSLRLQLHRTSPLPTRALVQRRPREIRRRQEGLL